MIIGLSGTFASGKDTLAHHLTQKYNFTHFSTGDMVRVVAEAEYGDIKRPTLVKTANELREKRGPGVLADLAMERYNLVKNNYDGLVISGVRSLGEARLIKDRGGKLIFIDAPIEVRYKRIKDRRRANEDVLSFEDFKKSEELESPKIHDDPTVQDIPGVKELADIILFNTGDIEAYLKDAEQKLGLN
jgi:dephospho-CoA kinase